ncbi:CDP-glycerol glycerophosphotransferase family protein [Dyadobacter sp. CY323]|uniref:CDP-glycerol glycerophosphotransferase family protein n=1 Tax=Dyadobacter sp. CY323 TaxID=2907302 RepID=UPI001F2AC2CC|nr:CDP-glycerol glycerophosphotransferase family protein [Dyadobacter sp. CY323]MCE6988670.1 CDP-glycerol glycerophosphotransferase family protein [Dyadobacter sp. CY323]
MNLIHSGLLKRLSEKYRIHLLSTLIGKPEIQQLNRYHEMNVNLIDAKIAHEHFLLKILRRCEKLLFSFVFEIETQEIKLLCRNKMFQKGFSCVRNARILRFIADISLRWFRNAIILLSKRLTSLPELAGYHFDGVISTSPLDIRENCIVNFLVTNKIRSMAMVISWDNLTSKGMMNANHEYVLVWNQLMAAEYHRFYNAFGFPAKVCITGIPRFDRYFETSNDTRSKKDFCRQFQIPETHKIILFATSARKHFRSQMLIAKHVIEYLQLHTDLTLVIRCHPDDPIDAYQQLAEPRIRIWHPGNRTYLNARTFSDWLPPFDFLHSLHEMLRNCDTCIQVASTIRLDAAACGKPIISIAYDDPEDTPYTESVRRLYDYSHQLPLNQLHVDTMVHRKQQLFNALNNALARTELLNKPQDKIRLFTHFTQPKSVETVLKYVDEWLK